MVEGVVRIVVGGRKCDGLNMRPTPRNRQASGAQDARRCGKARAIWRSPTPTYLNASNCDARCPELERQLTRPNYFTCSEQVEAIRAQLSATLTGARLSDSSYGNTNDLSKSINTSISRTTPGLGLVASVDSNTIGGGGGRIGDDDIFGEGDQEDGTCLLSLAELQRAVEERKQTRPAGIERQVRRLTTLVKQDRASCKTFLSPVGRYLRSYWRLLAKGERGCFV